MNSRTPGIGKGFRMRVVLSTIGSRGDVQPLVALASRRRITRHRHCRRCPDRRHPRRMTIGSAGRGTLEAIGMVSQ